MCFSPETKALVKEFFLNYPEEESLTAKEALEDGTEFILTYFRGSKVPVNWQTLSNWMNRRAGQGLGALAERETIRCGIIDRLELELEFHRTYDKVKITAFG